MTIIKDNFLNLLNGTNLIAIEKNWFSLKSIQTYRRNWMTKLDWIGNQKFGWNYFWNWKINFIQYQVKLKLMMWFGEYVSKLLKNRHWMPINCGIIVSKSLIGLISVINSLFHLLLWTILLARDIVSWLSYCYSGTINESSLRAIIFSGAYIHHNSRYYDAYYKLHKAFIFIFRLN